MSTTTAKTEDLPSVEKPSDGLAAKEAQTEKGSKASKLAIVLLMVAACMSVFLAALDITIVTTALPTIATYFGSSAGFVWVGSAFMLTAAVTTANWGKFSDVWGRKPLLLTASAVFFAGCAMCGAAPSLPVLIAGRVIQGAGAGGLLTLVNIIVGDLFSPRERGKYYGMIGMVWATASALGPVVGGALTSNVSWRWCFYINLPISGTAFFIIALTLRLPSPKTPILAGLRAIDWLGSITITGGTLMLLLGLQFGGNVDPWRSAPVIGLICGGAVTLGLFAIIERFIAVYPVVPPHLFSGSTSNIAVIIVCFGHSLAFTQLTYFLPTYFQAVLGSSPLISGVWVLATCLPVSVCAASSGIYLKKTGRFRDPIIVGLFLAILGCGLLYDLPRNAERHTASAWARIIIFQAIAGAGLGLNFQPPLIALQSNVPPQDNATATSTFALTRNMASAIAVVTGSAAFVNQMGTHHDAVLAATNNATIAELLTGSSVQANLLLVDSLSADAQTVVRDALYASLRSVWIQAVCYAAFSFLVAVFFVRSHTLKHDHEMVKVGLSGEEERRRIALERRKQKKAKPGDTEGDSPDETS